MNRFFLAIEVGVLLLAANLLTVVQFLGLQVARFVLWSLNKLNDWTSGIIQQIAEIVPIIEDEN